MTATKLPDLKIDLEGFLERVCARFPGAISAGQLGGEDYAGTLLALQGVVRSAADGGLIVATLCFPTRSLRSKGPQDRLVWTDNLLGCLFDEAGVEELFRAESAEMVSGVAIEAKGFALRKVATVAAD